MDNKYRFGRIDVNCEGYDYPDDPYILRGSCGVSTNFDDCLHLIRSLQWQYNQCDTQLKRVLISSTAVNSSLD